MMSTMAATVAGAAVSRYKPELDGLRALAVAAVFACHALPSWLPAGWLGVDLFFVLSGYLITSLLVAEHAEQGEVALGRFWGRRALRLMPAFVVVAVVCAPWVDGMGWVAGNSANWARVSDIGLGPLGHLWSLAVEEQFYVLWPMVLVVMLGRRVNPAPVIAWLIVAVTVWRWWLETGGAQTNRIYFATDTRADALLYGCLLAVIAPRVLPLYRRGMGLAAGAFLLGVAVLGPLVGPGMDPYYSAVALASVVVIVAALVERPAWLRSSPLVWLGVRSYGLYLWHWPVVWALHSTRPALAAVLTVTIAAVSYHYVERPFLAWKARLRTDPVGRHGGVRVGDRNVEVAA